MAAAPVTRRLGLFVALGLVGAAGLLAGLTWDAVLHAHDPALAAQEGIFTLANPSHLLMGVGMALVVAGLVGAAFAALAASGGPRGTAARRLLLVVSAAVVVGSGATTSWVSVAARQQAHDGAEEAGAHLAGKGHDQQHSVADLGHHDPTAAVAHAQEHVAAQGGPSGHRHQEAAAHPPGHARNDRALVAGQLRASATAPTPTTMRYGPIRLAPAGPGEGAHVNMVVPGVPKPCSAAT